jgi:hypothetical protein
MKKNSNVLSASDRDKLFNTLQARFEKNKGRHKGIDWAKVEARLKTQPDKLWSLQQMEATGGEPDVVGQDKKSGDIIFYDCAPESPAGRRSICYDKKALDARKENKPKDSAMNVAASMGVNLLTEAQYRELQEMGDFDTKTSSWLLTPPAIRQHGGAIFGDKRYKHVFIYHNGADSYYAARGFRASLKI